MGRRGGTSPLEYLDSVIGDAEGSRRAARQERLRLQLARVMKKSREAAGLTQKEVAKALGVTQAWVSKLESANHDHKLESVLTYIEAVGAEMNLGIRAGDTTFQVWGKAEPQTLWSGLLAGYEISEYRVDFTNVFETLDIQLSSPLSLAEGGHTDAGVVSLSDYRDRRDQSVAGAAPPREARAS